MDSNELPIVLFDGVCRLCNGWVDFLLARDTKGTLRFAALQSAFARDLLGNVGHPIPSGDPRSIVLLERGHVYERSTAALRTLGHLPGGWSLLAALFVIPRPLRDAVYDWVAAHRYRWFGKTESCRLPTPESQARFLDNA